MSDVLECASCNSENLRSNKFCGSCGAKLPLICTSCSSEIPAGNKFCGHCGTATDTDNEPDISPPAPPSPSEDIAETEAERRQLTVMFCDLADSTALSEKLDPEDLRDVISTYQNTCTGLIKKYDGYIARFMGDGILIYFGYPVASEDTAERAVRSGLEIIAAIQEIEPAEKFELRVRLGIATGLVVAGDIIGEGAAEEHAVLGMTPNLAARLQSIAEPNTLVISNNTRELTGGFFNYQDLGKHELKGISELEQAWQVIGEKETSGRFEAASEKGITPLVGREEEISLLINRWQRAVEGDGQVAILFGEAGVGKSRIVDGFLKRVTDETNGTIYLSCSPFHINSAFYPLTQCFLRVMDIRPGDSKDQRVEKMEKFISDLGLDLESIASPMAAILIEATDSPYPPLSGTPEQIKNQIFTAIFKLLEVQCARQPIMFIVEDTHWIDPSTLEFLDQLIPQLRRLRVLLIVAARPTFAADWSAHPHVTTLMLNRLSRSDSLAMIGNVTAGKALPEEVIAQIIERTDGIPLFVEELTKTVLESELLIEEKDQYVLSGSLSDLAIPNSLQDSLMARLDNLAPVKEVAQLASVIGRNFSEHLLSAVSPLDDDQLSSSLEELISAELIFKNGMPPNVVYEFKHALVQRAAYTSLLKSTRHRHHLRIAETLEENFPDIVETEPEILAHHYTAAETFDKAAAYWQIAGQRASTRWAYKEAIGHLELGLEAIEKLPESDDRAALEVELLTELVAGQRILDRFDDAFKTLDRAEKIATQYDRFEDLALIHYFRGSIYFPLGNIERCLEEHELARQNARKANSPENEARALSGLADANFLRGHLISANEHFGECLSLIQENNLSWNISSNLAMFGHTKLYLLDLENGLKDTQEAVDIAVAANNLRGEMIARGSCGAKILFDLARYDEAQEQCEQALEIAQRLGAHRFEPVNYVILAKIHALKGDVDKAIEIAKQGVETSHKTAFKYTGPMALGALAAVSTDTELIYQAFAEAEETLKEDCVGHNYLWFYRDAIDVCLRLEDWENLEKYARAAEEYTQDEPLPWMDVLVARGRALSAYYQNPKDQKTLENLADIKSKLLAAKFISILPAIDEALSR
jgi:class 3 adenylate cyclase/tetratricopeptide (TPR) repeat protein